MLGDEDDKPEEIIQLLPLQQLKDPLCQNEQSLRKIWKAIKSEKWEKE